MKREVEQALERFESANRAGNMGFTAGSATSQADAAALATIRAALEDGARLDALVNNPQTEDFLFAVRMESVHQVEKLGEAHDRGKSAENWFWLVGYLAGKCLRAAITGDRTKALHHTISTAAACANWHRAIQADTTGTGIGDDRDLIEIARFVGVDARAADARATAKPATARDHLYLGGSGHGSTVPLD